MHSLKQLTASGKLSLFLQLHERSSLFGFEDRILQFLHKVSQILHTYIIAHLMGSSSIVTKMTPIRFGITVMKIKLNSQNIFGT